MEVDTPIGTRYGHRHLHGNFTALYFQVDILSQCRDRH